MKANASEHKAMSYGRMTEEEARLEAEVKELLQKAQAVDEEEDKMKHGSTPPQALRGRIPKGMPIADRMRRKLRTKKGRKCYGLRKELSEPVYGQIKQGRGFRQFLLRGKEKVGGEWKLIGTVHNVLRLFGAWHKGLVRQRILTSEAFA